MWLLNTWNGSWLVSVETFQQKLSYYTARLIHQRIGVTSVSLLTYVCSSMFIVKKKYVYIEDQWWNYNLFEKLFCRTEPFSIWNPFHDVCWAFPVANTKAHDQTGSVVVEIAHKQAWYIVCMVGFNWLLVCK